MSENDRITLTALAQRHPGRRPGKRLHTATAHRWALAGVRGVKLRTELAGGMRYTTWAWYEGFALECAAVRGGRRPRFRKGPTARTLAAGGENRCRRGVSGLRRAGAT